MKPSRTPIARGLTACTLAVALAWSWAGQALAQSVYVSSEKDNKVLVFDAAQLRSALERRGCHIEAVERHGTQRKDMRVFIVARKPDGHRPSLH